MYFVECKKTFFLPSYFTKFYIGLETLKNRVQRFKICYYKKMFRYCRVFDLYISLDKTTIAFLKTFGNQYFKSLIYLIIQTHEYSFVILCHYVSYSHSKTLVGSIRGSTARLVIRSILKISAKLT